MHHHFFANSIPVKRQPSDGEIIDLGGRRLEILHVPGHTPDAVALLDAENGLLFTGDTWYDASIPRLANLEGRVISRTAAAAE